jgi:site-specific DNA recombinase
MSRIIGYVRVSTSSQSDQGVSLAAQEAKIRAWADLNGYDEVAIYSDPGISGAKIETRKGLQDALKAIKKGDALVAYSLSRLSRSTKDMLGIADLLSKRGADLVSITEKIDTTSAAGKMLTRMLMILSEFERDQVSERTRCALQHMKQNRQRVGAIPFGFRLCTDGKTLEEDPKEQVTISKARHLRKKGYSLRKISAALAEARLYARNGRTFEAMQVRAML